MFKLFIFCLFALFFSYGISLSYEWKDISIKNLYYLYHIKSFNNKIYVTAYPDIYSNNNFYLYVSKNNGADWKGINVNDYEIYNINTLDNQLIISTVSSKLLLLDTITNNWSLLKDFKKYTGSRLNEIYYTNSKILYYRIGLYDLFKSSDRGKTWDTIKNIQDLDPWEISINPVFGYIFVMPRITKKIYASFDGGNKWDTLNLNIPLSIYSKPAFNDKGDVFISSTVGWDRIYKSNSRGNNFKIVYEGNSDDNVSGFYFKKQYGFAFKKHDILMSKDWGETWPIIIHTPINQEGHWIMSCTLDDDNNLYIMSDSISIYTTKIELMSVEEEKTKKIHLQCYPNPTDNIININYQIENPAFIKLFICDHLGKQRIIKNCQNISAGKYVDELDLSSYAQGLYLIIMQVGNTVYTKNIIKK